MDSLTINIGKNGLTPSSTFNGGNISPNITLGGVNADMQYITLIVQNKSGSEPSKCIWCIWDIPSVGYIPPGYEEGGKPSFPFPAIQGINDFGEHAWHGPSPGLGVTDRLMFQVFGRNEPLGITYDSNMDKVIEKLRDGKTVAYGYLETIYMG